MPRRSGCACSTTPGSGGCRPTTSRAAPRPDARCLGWLADLGCRPHGFVSYIDESGQGLANQGWKDSWDAVQFRDGRIASAPLALCEVQGYAYEAATAGAELVEAFGQDGADRWREFAAGLAKRFRARFWVEDSQGAYPAIALEADGTPVDSLSSNIGHLLGTGFLRRAESDLVARRLGQLGPQQRVRPQDSGRLVGRFQPAQLPLRVGMGRTTLPSPSPGWPARRGPALERRSCRWSTGCSTRPKVSATGCRSSTGATPEETSGAPLPYPASCHPQAWAAASSIAIMAALLGVRPDVPGGTVELSPVVADPSSRASPA